jgi:hypothetical protein
MQCVLVNSTSPSSAVRDPALARAGDFNVRQSPPVVPPVSQVTYAELDVKKDSTHQIVVRRA